MSRRLVFCVCSLALAAMAAIASVRAIGNLSDFQNAQDLGAMGYLTGTIIWGFAAIIAWIFAASLLGGALVARPRRKDA